MDKKYEPLRKGVLKFAERYGHGGQSELARRSNVNPATLSRLVKRKRGRFNSSTWLRLHLAAPDDIPVPPREILAGESDPATNIKSIVMDLDRLDISKRDAEKMAGELKAVLQKYAPEPKPVHQDEIAELRGEVRALKELFRGYIGRAAKSKGQMQVPA